MFEINITHNKVKSGLVKVNFELLQTNFIESSKTQAQSFKNYMKVFEYLLLFLRTTQQQNWILQLKSLHELSKYFFANDVLNYARLTPRPLKSG